MINNNLKYANDVLHEIIVTAAPNFSDISESLEEMDNKRNSIIKQLATELCSVLIDFVDSDIEDIKNNISIKAIHDSYGKGIEIAWKGSAETESKFEFSKVFKAIHTLNFMDFYQRFNKYTYIKESIENFTNCFKDRILESKPITIDNDEYDQIIELLGLNKRTYELMVSRQEITKPINTLKDSVENTENFKEKDSELTVKDLILDIKM